MATIDVSPVQGFDENYYLAAKAAQLTATTGQSWNVAQTLAAIQAAGLTAEQHYSIYGYNEGLAPNAYYNDTYYATSKAAQAGITVDQLRLAWYNASGSTNLYTHYMAYGAYETGVNPSSGFNDASYYAAKAAQMGGTTTPDQAKAAIQAAGMNAISHYLLYGINENLTYTPTASPVVGQTYTLTDGIDIVNGTSGNDTIVAGTKAAAATLTGGDQIDGGAGTDTIKLYGQVNTANFNGANIKNVEVVDAYFDNAASTLNVAANSGVTTVNVGDSTVTNGAGTGRITVTAAKAQAVGITGTILNDTTTSAAGNNANVTFAFSDVTGGADTATLNVNDAKFAKNAANVAGTGSGVTIAGVETLNIAATGTNALGNLLTAQTTKMVITGAGSLSATLSQAAGLTKTIDGSAATGNLTIDNKAAAAAVESIKTGAGNDTYTTVYANLTKDDVIDMGTGTDSLRFSDAATFNSAATEERLTKVTGVEQLGLQSDVAAALTIDGDFVSQTSYYVGGKLAAAALSNVANNADVTFGKTDVVTNATGANTVAMKLGSNTLNVNLAGATDGASVVGGVVATVGDGLGVIGSATINVKSSGTDGQPNNVLDLTAADNQSVVVTGSQNLTLVATAKTGTTGFSIDGSAFTGKLTVTGTAASDIVKGGSGDDIISGGAGAVADTLTGGAGNDKFIVIAGVTAATADTITDFVTKADKIDFAAAGNGVALAAAGDYTEATAAVADFAAALAAANLVLTNAGGTKQVNVQQVGSDSWVFYNNGGAAGADQVVKLTGVALTGIEFGDILA